MIGPCPEDPERVLIRFTHLSPRQPGLWCPALGRPLAEPMLPASEGCGHWFLERCLPANAELSWAIVEDHRAASPRPLERTLAFASSRHRAALGKRFGELLTAPTKALIPTPYELIGVDPAEPVPARASVLRTGQDAPDQTMLAAIATGRAVEPDRMVALASGHRLTRFDTAGKDPGPEAWGFDGELLERLLPELAGHRWWMLEGPSAEQRFRDHARPKATARKLLTIATQVGADPGLIIAASVAAATAVRFAAGLPAQPDSRRVILLSPAFPGGEREADRLARIAVDAGLEVRVRAGSEERARRGRRPSLLALAERFAARAAAAGNTASFATYPGGHDLAPWRRVLLEELTTRNGHHSTENDTTPLRRTETP